jgi:hypothetical protein
VPALAGDEFSMRWQTRTAADLFDKTRTTVPTGASGSLSEQTYLDLIAYILQVNDPEMARELRWLEIADENRQSGEENRS